MKDKDNSRKHHRSSGAGRSPTKYMEQSKSRSEEGEDISSRDPWDEEGVDSGQVTSNDEERGSWSQPGSLEDPGPPKSPLKKDPTSSEQQRREVEEEYPGKDDEPKK